MQVIGHIWGGQPGDLGKKTIALATGNYDFKIAEKLFGPSNVYIASRKGHAHFPPVMAYAVGVVNEYTSHEKFISMVEDLAKICTVASHIIAWPGVPMAAVWAHLHDSNGHSINSKGHGQNGKPHTIPWDYFDRGFAIPFPPNNTLQELSGIWNAYISSGECFTQIYCVTLVVC